MLDSFFISPSLHPAPETGVYQPSLVFLSYVVASFASYTALSLAQLIVGATNRRERNLLQWGGAFAMGAGIWSMHFIGMLSYKMRMVIHYDPFLTLFSMLIAIAVAYGVLNIVARAQLSLKQIAVGAILLGFGICAMHYTGMAAMIIDGDLRYRLSIFILSFAIAVAASAAALGMAFTLARSSSQWRYLYQIVAALIMGLGICGMHYTGIAAAIFIPWADCRYTPDQDFSALATAIAATTSIILGMALTGGIYKKTQTEILLQSNEKKLRSIIDSALDAVVVMDEQGLVTEWNHQAETIFGWTHEEVLGKKLSDYIVPYSYRERHEKGLERFLTDGSGPILNKRVEMEACRRDSNNTFPVELTVTAQEVRGTYHFTAFIRDISEHKRSDEIRALLAAIIHSSEEVVISKTLNGTITSWNAAAEKLFGYSSQEAIGQNINLIVPPERTNEERKIMEQLNEGKKIDNIETLRMRRDGRLIDISLTVSPVLNTAGRITGASSIAHDITDRKLAEARMLDYMKQLERSNQQLDDFSYIVSHDLKEPLRGLHNFSSFLLQDYSNRLDDEGKGMLMTLAKLSQQMEQLMNALLHYSRLGRTDLSVKKTDLNEVVNSVISMQAITIKEKNSQIHIPQRLPTITCDHVRIAEVFQNLIGNALKYNDNKNIIIEIGYAENLPEHPGKILFFVRDNGIGIPQKSLEAIFKIFRRLHLRDAYGGGTGSGLTIAQKIIEQHSGKIWAESPGEGQGSTFYFTLNSE